MNVLAVVAHPDIEASRLHRVWTDALQVTPGVTVHNLYKTYRSWTINAPAEQTLLITNDRIVLQFPLYLYSCPPMLKKWMDDVFLFRWAYGPGGTALRGKEFMIATSTGGPSDGYRPGGYHNYTMDEFLRPLQQVVNLVGGIYLKPFLCDRARTMTIQEVEQSARHLAAHVVAPSTAATGAVMEEMH